MHNLRQRWVRQSNSKFLDNGATCINAARGIDAGNFRIPGTFINLSARFKDLNVLSHGRIKNEIQSLKSLHFSFSINSYNTYYFLSSQSYQITSASRSLLPTELHIYHPSPPHLRNLTNRTTFKFRSHNLRAALKASTPTPHTVTTHIPCTWSSISLCALHNELTSSFLDTIVVVWLNVSLVIL